MVSKDISIDEEITDDIKYALTSRYNTINDNPYEEKVLNLNCYKMDISHTNIKRNTPNPSTDDHPFNGCLCRRCRWFQKRY